MSRLTEYITLVGKGLKNPKEVAEGWINVVRQEFGTLAQDQVEEVAKRRFLCSQCPFVSDNAKIIANYKTERTDSHCTLCSCPVLSKTASMSSVCGAKYYNETHPGSTLTVQWEAYESDKA